jgi:Nucleotidyl transferase AbiEii toxin, Type IV TA system
VDSFTPKLEILPAAQRLLWQELGAIPGGFTLYGGTAIALHLGHRQSIDFDFFGDHAFAPFSDPGLRELAPELQQRLVAAVRGVDLASLPAIDPGTASS